MRRWVGWVVGVALAFMCGTADAQVLAQKTNQKYAQPFNADSTGVAAAIAYCTPAGIVQIGPGLETVGIASIPSNVLVFHYVNGAWRLRGSNVSLNVRNATPGLNGNVDATLYSDKTLSLLSASSGQADKGLDVVNRYTDSTAFTNLSLNGGHFICRFGSGGFGGGNVATGMGVGGYSEHRGSSALTGALYGGEFATTMYNYGSVVTAFGSLNTSQVTTGANASITTAIGTRGIARFYAGAGTITTAIGVSGIAGTEQSATGTITDAYGGKFETEKSGGTITNATALTVTSPVSIGGTNNFGVRITGTPSGGSNLNQALRVDSGPTFLGGTLAVGGQGASLIIQSILCATASLDFNLTSVVSQDLTITVTGAAVGDPVFIGIPNGSVTADTGFTAWVSATDTVKIRAFRLAGTPDPASGTFRATVFHY